jgi:hypothetical protein
VSSLIDLNRQITERWKTASFKRNYELLLSRPGKKQLQLALASALPDSDRNRDVTVLRVVPNQWQSSLSSAVSPVRDEAYSVMKSDDTLPSD